MWLPRNGLNGYILWRKLSISNEISHLAMLGLELEEQFGGDFERTGTGDSLVSPGLVTLSTWSKVLLFHRTVALKRERLANFMSIGRSSPQNV